MLGFKKARRNSVEQLIKHEGRRSKFLTHKTESNRGHGLQAVEPNLTEKSAKADRRSPSVSPRQQMLSAHAFISTKAVPASL